MIQTIKNFISLGAGVQSSTMALMAAKGQIEPMPSGAIFADTGAEPSRVYTWLDWLEKQLPFPVYRVMHKEGLLRNLLATKGRFVAVPFFTDFGKGGMTRRQCTREFKVEPIEKKLRELVGLKKGQRAPNEILVTQYIGISLDEATRMKESQTHWIRNRWPLIEKRMKRSDCLEWMKDNGYPKPAKSSCTFCPYHDAHSWRDMKVNDPEGWAQAVQIDRHIRTLDTNIAGTVNAKLYLHRSLTPLESVDFSTPEERGQLNLFENECEGLCGN